MPGPDDLVARVRDRHVVVVGASLTGLVAAWECARVGLAVTVLDAADHIGGGLAPTRSDGRTIDGAALDISGGDTEVDTVLTLLGVETSPSTTPRGDLLGIPANPWAEEVRRVIGWRGTWRAYLDRLRPPLTIGREESLGALVRRRMGGRVADRLVAPRAAERWETPLDLLDADAVLPGISAALTRTGSLSGAIAQLSDDAPAPRRILSGAALDAALEEHLQDLGADVRTAHTVSTIARDGDAWRVTAEEDVFDADAVIVATGPAEARRLLAAIVPDIGEATRVDEVEIVTRWGDGDEDVRRSRRVTRGTGRRVGDAARIRAARTVLAGSGGLSAVGGWLSGGEVTDQIADAVRTAEQVRSTLLWGDDPGPATS